MLILNVVVQWSLVFLASAHARSIDLVEPRGTTMTEVQSCEKQLSDLWQSEMRERLTLVHANEAVVQSTLERLQEAGTVQTERDWDIARMQLTIGAELLNEVLLPEAVYQVFKVRYGSKEAIRRALMAFKDISHPADQGVLLSEVIERLLQLITDVGPDNLSAVPTTAAFIGLSGGQMRAFREKWIYYNQDDEFARILQTGVLYAMLSTDPGFPDRVVSRGGLFRSLRRRIGMVKVPPRPTPTNPKLDPREVQLEDVEYYDQDELAAYLDQSSTAARQYFVSSRMAYLTRDQLERIHDRARVLRLKPSLIAAIDGELARRRALRPLWERVRDLDRDRTELRSRITRAEDGHVYDKNQIDEELGQIFAERDAKVVAERAGDLLKNQVDRCDEVRYARLVGKIVSVSNSRFGGAPEAALSFIGAAVGHGNAFNLTDDQLKKVQLDLTELAGHLPRGAQRRARALVQKLVTSRPKFMDLKLEQLKAQLARTEPELAAAKRELDQRYQR